MNLKKLNTKCGVYSSPLSLFRKFDVFHTVSVNLCRQTTVNVWIYSGFLKINKGLLCTPDLVCSFFKLISYIFKGKVTKYNIFK